MIIKGKKFILGVVYLVCVSATICYLKITDAETLKSLFGYGAAIAIGAQAVTDLITTISGDKK